MPIEINELVIRAVVNETPTLSESTMAPNRPSEEEIVACCVKQVLDILKRQKER